MVSDGSRWVGVTVVDRHRLTEVDRIDLTGLAGEVFDVHAVAQFDDAPGPQAYRERCVLLAKQLVAVQSASEVSSETQRSASTSAS